MTDARVETQLPNPPVIAGYRLKEIVDIGPASQVWRAVDERSDRVVAVKITAPLDQDALVRFGRETSLLAQLEHPNLLRLYGSGRTDDGRTYMVLEWIDGSRSLRNLMSHTTRFRWLEAAQLGVAVANALATAHARGILHRDIKPSNILIPPGGLADAKLADFGVLGALDQDDAKLGKTTIVGVVAGTPLYMAPEQFSGQRLSVRSDLYSLGLVLREMIWPRGGPAPTVAELLYERLHAEAPASSQVPEDSNVPAPVRELLRAMLRREPSERPAGAEQVARVLLDALHNSTLVPAPAAHDSTPHRDIPYASSVEPTPPNAQPARSTASSSLAVVCTLLLLACVTAWMVAPRMSPKSVEPPAATTRPSLVVSLTPGLSMMFGGLLLGVLASHAIERRRTLLEQNVALALTGNRKRESLSRTMIATVDAIIRQTSKLDARFLGATIIGMVHEYDVAKESSDKQQALVRATELLEKLLEKTSPWYVRNSKWVVAAASFVGLVSGATKLLSDFSALFR